MWAAVLHGDLGFSFALRAAVRLLEHTLERKQDGVADTPLPTGRLQRIGRNPGSGSWRAQCPPRLMSTPRFVLQGFATLNTTESMGEDFQRAWCYHTELSVEPIADSLVVPATKF